MEELKKMQLDQVNNQNQQTDNQNQQQNSQNSQQNYQNSQTDKKDQEIKTFTQEEVAKMVEAEADRRVSEAVKTREAKVREEMEQKLEKERSEAEKLAKMSEQERMQAEINKKMEEFEKERKEFLKEKLHLQTIKELSANELPTDFSDFLLAGAETAEEIKSNIDTFKAQWEQAIEKAVNEKLKGTTPKSATKQGGKQVTKEEFMKMSYKEKMELYESDKELYMELRG